MVCVSIVLMLRCVDVNDWLHNIVCVFVCSKEETRVIACSSFEELSLHVLQEYSVGFSTKIIVINDS